MQMKTDTAAIVTHEILDLRKSLANLKFIDAPVIAVDRSHVRFIDEAFGP